MNNFIKILLALFNTFRSGKYFNKNKIILWERNKILGRVRFSLDELLHYYIPNKLSLYRYGTEDFADDFLDNIKTLESNLDDVVEYLFYEINEMKYLHTDKNFNIIKSKILINANSKKNRYLSIISDSLESTIQRMVEKINNFDTKHVFITGVIATIMFISSLFISRVPNINNTNTASTERKEKITTLIIKVEKHNSSIINNEEVIDNTINSQLLSCNNNLQRKEIKNIMRIYYHKDYINSS